MDQKRFGWLPLEEAIEKIENAAPILKTEQRPLGLCHNYILAEDFVAQMETPPFDRSPLDGYALRAADTAGASKDTPKTLKVAEVIYAGDVPSIALEEGIATRIMTGAMLPEGATCVIRQEDTDYGEDVVQIYAQVADYENYVRKGEDVRKGTLILPEGSRLGAVELSLLSSLGVSNSLGFAELLVYSYPKIAVYSSGDELMEVGQPLLPGKIYDSNRQFMVSRLCELSVPVTSSGHLPDKKDEIIHEIKRLSDEMDIIITTGGVSVGQKDLMPEVVEALDGELVFWGVAMKPGSPALVWKYQNTLIINLSGNPFAALATFELIARPALVKMSRGVSPATKREKAILTSNFLKASHGRRFIRGYYSGGQVHVPSKHASGVFGSMMGCNCLIDIEAGSPYLKQGDEVSVVLL